MSDKEESSQKFFVEAKTRSPGKCRCGFCLSSDLPFAFGWSGLFAKFFLPAAKKNKSELTSPSFFRLVFVLFQKVVQHVFHQSLCFSYLFITFTFFWEGGSGWVGGPLSCYEWVGLVELRKLGSFFFLVFLISFVSPLGPPTDRPFHICLRLVWCCLLPGGRNCFSLIGLLFLFFNPSHFF